MFIGVLWVSKQWGNDNTNTNTDNHKFSITFPNQCLAVVCSSKKVTWAYVSSWNNSSWSGDIATNESAKTGDWYAVGS